MSEKVTFQELIESIAQETDNTKQFTHDFLKDFVDVINDGLEKDGDVNIAGFGKFELKRVDEREGFNPQTEEKITIPAHNKIVFKPYKDLRELVNAPYAHMEPELLEDEDEQDSEEQRERSDAGDAGIAGVAAAAESAGDQASDEDETHEDPFGFGEQSSSSSDETEQEQQEGKEESGEDGEDIVEFNGSFEGDSEEEVDKELSEFVGAEEQPSAGKDEAEQEKEQEEKDVDQSETAREDKPETAEESEDIASDKDEKEQTEPAASPGFEEGSAETAPPTPRFQRNLRSRKKQTSLPMVVIAACIILLVAIGVWYFSLLPQTDSADMAAEQSVPETTQQAEPRQAQQQEPAEESDTQAQQGNNQQAAQQGAQADAKDTEGGNEDKQPREQIGIQKGQTLWSIAEDTYGNPRLWPWIYDKNESLGDPDLIYAGSSLTVPLPSGPQNSLAPSDSVGVAKGYLATYRWYKDQESPAARNHLWAAKLYHENLRDIADVQIDDADLAYANKAR